MVCCFIVVQPAAERGTSRWTLVRWQLIKMTKVEASGFVNYVIERISEPVLCFRNM